MSSKEKGKFEEMAKNDKVRYEREMKGYVPPKGAKGGKKQKSSKEWGPCSPQDKHCLCFQPNQ